MTTHAFDPEIIRDFLTESGELLEQLEGDLIVLEERPADPDLLNQVFRALHTIKGSASFLALTELVEAAHAAENALNAARNGAISVDRTVMDLLLRAIDVLKIQFGELESGDPLTAADPALVTALAAAAKGNPPTTPTPAASVDAAHPAPLGARILPLELPADKDDLIDFLVDDLEQTFAKIDEQFAALTEEPERAHAADELIDLADALIKNAEFFDFEPMQSLAQALLEAASSLGEIENDAFGQLMPRLHAVRRLLGEQAAGLKDRKLLAWRTDELLGRIAALSRGEPASAPLPNGADAELALRTDGVVPGDDEVRTGAGARPAPDADTTPPPPASGTPRNPPAIEQTIRVDVKRLETLMNLVGELVLQKNRISAISRNLLSSLDQDRREHINAAAGDLDRITSDMQVAVMRTRMQPLDRLFGRYPRLIRDLAAKTGKQIRLDIEGGETEVDKSVIEELGDPLVHIMRNSADHGIESPGARADAGKPAEGVIRLSASHEGSHVRVRIADDGRGLDRDTIGALAVKRGLATEPELAALGEAEVYRFIFAPGFSTAAAVSDISGRGVGMDVVRTNIEKLKGTIDVASEPGRGTELSITIPLTIAIMPAMMVAVAGEIYAVPLGNILEIVRPRPEDLSTIGDGPVMRLRDTVLPLVSGAEVFDVPDHAGIETPFAVVLSLNEKRVGLLVTRPVGQQEIVVKPLDIAGAARAAGPVSGATVRDDGGVSLIVDVAELIRTAEGRRTQAAA